MSQQKKPWEMTYAEIYEAWSEKFAFGSKGELTVHEAKQVHQKWKKLGILAKRGVL